ncbi:hypothetical protein T265_01631 [Opisthorchis viverrini]|uniref:Uncharacterized protein n=1 Tax=Opisthorchis viverrini TaxID=6198 RepID=A0A074ZYS1_OPIVI|nr:hypothetical protein T265_01631 [Opisthorchis viverrini]KER32196.1 hypothetical protein T265_01631 [Opisthorchis viverrini]
MRSHLSDVIGVPDSSNEKGCCISGFRRSTRVRKPMEYAGRHHHHHHHRRQHDISVQHQCFTAVQLYVGWDTARAPTPRQEDDQGPQPKPLAQKPNRKAAVLAGNANVLPFLRNKSPHVPTPNLEGQETVFVRPLTIDQPGMRDSVCRGTLSSIAQWIAEMRKPSHHGKVQSLRDGTGRRTFSCSTPSVPCCDFTRNKYEGRYNARFPEPRHEQCRCTCQVWNTDILVSESQQISFSCSTLSVPGCHATRRRHESWDAARSPKPKERGEAEVGFEPRTFRSVNSRSNHLVHLAPANPNRRYLFPSSYKVNFRRQCTPAERFPFF